MTKNFKNSLALSFLLTIAVTVPATAQTVLCSKTMNPKSCDLLAEPAEAVLRMLEAPADWTWVILDGKDWRKACKQFKTKKKTTAAFTVLELRTTFLNKEYLQRLRPLLPKEVLAHELAHISCNCRSELTARKIGGELLAKIRAEQE